MTDYEVTANELRQFIERYEHLEAKKKGNYIDDSRAH